mmetsp:Transcript_6980/g.17827  ORF Transcript_6980/g.17827 Transcript_6980/m.17827 type:complete len:318 (+) Transcript_6980:1756-2709(+)
MECVRRSASLPVALFPLGGSGRSERRRLYQNLHDRKVPLGGNGGDQVDRLRPSRRAPELFGQRRGGPAGAAFRRRPDRARHRPECVGERRVRGRPRSLRRPAPAPVLCGTHQRGGTPPLSQRGKHRQRGVQQRVGEDLSAHAIGTGGFVRCLRGAERRLSRPFPLRRGRRGEGSRSPFLHGPRPGPVPALQRGGGRGGCPRHHPQRVGGSRGQAHGGKIPPGHPGGLPPHQRAPLFRHQALPARGRNVRKQRLVRDQVQERLRHALRVLGGGGAQPVGFLSLVVPAGPPLGGVVRSQLPAGRFPVSALLPVQGPPGH